MVSKRKHVSKKDHFNSSFSPSDTAKGQAMSDFNMSPESKYMYRTTVFVICGVDNELIIR